jgi:hypothetical protein
MRVHGTRLLQSTLLVALVAAPASADRVWSNADLQGRYSLGHTQTGVGLGLEGEARIGVLSFDGDGHVVAGSRTVVHWDGSVLVEDEQTVVSGTYSIGPDGRGEIHVTWTPLAIPYLIGASPGRETCYVRAQVEETMKVVLTPGRFQYLTTLHFSSEPLSACSGASWRHVYLHGEAVSQEAAPPLPSFAPLEPRRARTR